jgi:hypothetical protein
MLRHVIVSLFTVMALVSVTMGQDDKGDKAPECKVVHVPVVKKVALQYDGVASITVTANGEVPTGGYTNVVLVQRVYVKPPADGIWEFDMFACKPSGIVIQVITPVSATIKWEGPPRSLKGIRVYGSKMHQEEPVKWPKE